MCKSIKVHAHTRAYSQFLIHRRILSPFWDHERRSAEMWRLLSVSFYSVISYMSREDDKSENSLKHTQWEQHVPIQEKIKRLMDYGVFVMAKMAASSPRLVLTLVQISALALWLQAASNTTWVSYNRCRHFSPLYYKVTVGNIRTDVVI